MHHYEFFMNELSIVSFKQEQCCKHGKLQKKMYYRHVFLSQEGYDLMRKMDIL